MGGITILVLWGILLIVAVIAEFATQQLVSIWFAVGALGALITAALDGTILLQLFVFAALSLLLLVFTRPLLRKFFSVQVKETNAKMDIGKIAVVVQEVDAVKGTGRARLHDTEWIAESANAKIIIPVGTTVRVDEISGARLLVTPISQKEEVYVG